MRHLVTAALTALLSAGMPQGHLATSGVRVHAGGYVAIAAIWVTPGLTGDPAYRSLVTDDQQTAHRAASRVFTLVRIEVENASDLSVELPSAQTVRLGAGGQLVPPIAEASVLGTHGLPLPDPAGRVTGPHTTAAGLFAFPRVDRATHEVLVVVHPLRALAAGRLPAGTLPEFVLRFDAGRLDYPPDPP